MPGELELFNGVSRVLLFRFIEYRSQGFLLFHNKKRFGFGFPGFQCFDFAECRFLRSKSLLLVGRFGNIALCALFTLLASIYSTSPKKLDGIKDVGSVSSTIPPKM